MSNTSLLGSYGGLGSSGLTFRNILINGEVTRINQRGFGGNWAALSVGEYGYDRWKKAGTDTMSQVVEEGNFIPGAQYTLSGTNVTTQTLTAPSSGHWTITVQQTARFVMLEAGPVATPFEHRPIGVELGMCQRYYEKSYPFDVAAGSFPQYAGRQIALGPTNAGEPLCGFSFSVIKRAKPTITIFNAQTGTTGQVRRYNGSIATAINAADASSSNNASTKGVSFLLPASGSFTAGYTYDWHWTADAEL